MYFFQKSLPLSEISDRGKHNLTIVKSILANEGVPEKTIKYLDYTTAHAMLVRIRVKKRMVKNE